jgi:hypothetical protein
MWAAYVAARHERESRRVFLSVLASLLTGSTGAYGSTFSTGRFMHALDVVLAWALRIAGAVKRHFRRPRKRGPDAV